MKHPPHKWVMLLSALFILPVFSCVRVYNINGNRDKSPPNPPTYVRADYDESRPTYQERLTNARIDAVKARLDGMDRAIDVKTAELDRRLEALNELRSDVLKDREQFVRKDAYTAKSETIDKWVFTTEQRITAIETRSVVWMAAIGIFFALLQIAAHVFLHRGKKE